MNQPESNGRRPGILVLFIVLSIILITVWFRESETGPLHRARTAMHAVAAPLSATGEFVTRPVRGVVAWVGDLGVSRSQLERLRDQNERLRARVAELEEARLENVRLRRLVKLAQARELESVGARVIGRPTNSWEGVMTIDRGSSDGLSAGLPVIGPRGLLGQIVDVAPNSSRVRLITDQRSGVAAMIQRTRAGGIVHGSIGGSLSLDFVSMETTVRAGDVVITSGLGGVYPKGLVVGEVSNVDRAPGSLYQRIEVQPEGDIGNLEEILVLIGDTKSATPEGGE